MSSLQESDSVIPEGQVCWVGRGAELLENGKSAYLFLSLFFSFLLLLGLRDLQKAEAR